VPIILLKLASCVHMDRCMGIHWHSATRS